MRGRLRTGIVVTAAVTAAVALYILLTLPAAALRLDGMFPNTHVQGAIHVHSVRSDGTGSIEEIAAAAARTGTAFVILTDHGDGTRPPEPPRYLNGVLVIDAVELNTREGHIVALGLGQATPYPLAGSARDVIEDLHRLGAVAIAAHPDSPKESLRWRAMNAAVDGIEWINADSEWRDESPSRLVVGALGSLVRPAESIAALFSRPVASLRRWDQAARTRPVFGVAALDAHARIGWREDEEPRQRTALARPTYESMFQTLANVVVLEQPLTRNAADDASRLLDSLKSGRFYSIVRAFGEPASFSFSAEAGGRHLLSGGRFDQLAGSAVFSAAVAGAPGARVTLLRNGQRIESGQGSVKSSRAELGVYRAEVSLPNHDMPWIVSNPITIAAAGDESPGQPVQAAVTTAAQPKAIGPEGARWSTEHDPLSTATTSVEADSRVLKFTLGAGPAYGQYSALVVSGHDEASIDGVSFVGEATRPMRVSVQVRLPGGRDGERWQRSVYLDANPRPITLRLQDFEPVGRPTTRRPVAVPIHTVLFVVDTVNTAPGTEGQFAIRALELRVNPLSGG